MARDKLTVDLELNAAKARREVARLQKEIDKMGKGLGKAFGTGAGGGGDKVRALGSGLSKATVRADEFNKSLEASNARVIAFGASAGLIMQVDRALKAMVTSAIKVEKAMADVNVVMNASVKTLDQFGKGMFKVAKETAQGFDTVAEAATELARQGLGMEKTLSRTKDALILTRLTGMNAADAVKSLTAAVNSFNKEGVTSSQIVNRMAKVDAAFAVSSEDLAKAVSRVGSSAVDAGVSLNQLMAITTAVQQKTARGGAVIGNAFKTIFTRIQRTDVQKKLRNIGVVTTDMNGKLLDGVTILENLSRSFGTLSKAQQASVGESVAGVFQINILKAAMSDLVNVNSEYTKSLKIANQATNEAYERNEQLNQTLDALVNRTLANLTQAGAALGGGALEPAIRKVLGTVNATIESFGEGGAMEGLGKKVGKGLLAGIGNFISGPGIILVTAAFGKLALNLGKFATSALKDFMGLTNTAKQRVALEEAVIRLIQSEPTYLRAAQRGTLDILQVEKDIFAQIELNNLERAKASTYASAITTGLMAKGTTVGTKGGVTVSGRGAFGRGRPGGAAGFIPNFANAGAERAAAAAGGYRAGAIKTMRQPGAGTVMYNSAETVKRFPGMSQSAIMPPQGSPAGAGYKSAFGAAHGFDPYAGSGFVPNFVVTKSQKREGRRKAVKGDVELRATPDMGVLMAQAGSASPLRFTNNLSEIPKLIDAMRASTTYKHLYAGNKEGRYLSNDTKIRVKGMPVVSMFPMSDAEASSHADNQTPSTIKILQSSLNRYKNQVASKLWGLEGGGSLGDDFNVKRLSKGTAGDIFEEAVRSSLMDGDIDRNAAFDYSGERYAPKQLIKYMRTEGAKKLLLGRSKIEAKIGKEAAIDGNIPKKVFNDAVGTGDKLGLTKNKILREIQEQTGLKAALGFVPNFSPLTSAIGREMQAGVPASAIRIGSSPALKTSGNPGGVGVYNTIHEPAGLGQGISRSRASGINPKSHGAASGFVPNYSPLSMGYATSDEIKASREQAKAAKSNVASGKKFKVSADKMMMASMVLNMAASGLAAGTGAGPRVQGGVNAVANIGSMAGMGFAVGGPWGAAAGAGLGALTSLGDLSMAFGEEGRKAEAEEIRKQAKVISEALGNLKESIAGLGDLDYMSIEDRLKNYTKFQQQLLEIEGRVLEGGKKTAGVRKAFYTDPSIKKLRTAGGATDLKPGDYANISAALGKMETMAASMTAGDSSTIYGNMQKQIGLINLSRVGKPGEFQQTKLKEARQGALAMFPESLQEEMMTWRGQSSYSQPGMAPTGKGAMLGYAKKMEAYNKTGDVKDLRGALKSAIPVLEGTGQDHIVKSFRQMLKQDDASLGSLYNNPEAWASNNVFVAGQAGMQSLELLRKGEMAPMMMESMYGPQLSKGLNATSRLDKGQVSAMGRTAQEGLTTAGLDSRYGALSRTGARKRHFAGRAVDRVSAGRMAGITMAGDTLIEEQGRLQKEGAGDKARQARQLLALKQRDKFIQAEIKLRSTLVGSIQGITMSYDAQAALLKKFEKDYADASQTEIESKLKALDAQQKKDDDLSSSQIAEVKYLEGLRKLREANSRETTHGISEINKSRKSEKENIDKSTAARISERKAMLEFQRAVRVQAITDAEVKTRNEAAGLRGLQGEGYGITNREIADADKNARRARIRAGGAGDPGAAFREAFAYGDTDALLEFEDGVVSVANTMKSSFASAFQSISSGATTVGGAIAGMAQNILNSISQASSQMFTNMLFSRMGGGFSQGGLVPGYASGGVVTGGSGHQDDVLTRMQGGEFVIKKSAAQQIGYGTLNAINSYAGGGGVPQDNSNAAMGKMGAIAAGAGAVSGMIGAAMQPGTPKPLPMQDYGMGRGQYGFFGGAESGAGQGDSISAGRGRAQVSLGKSFAYYRRDPDTGELISERARPTEGRFEVSSRLSLLGRLGGDPQTSRMFGKEQKMASYQQYLADETKSRADQIQAVEDQKRARRIQAGVNAAMMIGGAYAMDKMQASKIANQKLMAKDTGGPGFVPPDMAGYGPDGYPMGSTNYRKSAYESGFSGGTVSRYNNYYQGGFPASPAPSPASTTMWEGGSSWRPGLTYEEQARGTKGIPGFKRVTDDPWLWTPGNANGGLAKVMGGEYVMSPEAVRTYGTDFMTELNRGNVPGFANGGPVGGAAVGGGGGGGMGNTNNVRINVNIDKRGAAEVSAESKTEDPTARGQEADDNNEVLNNKEFAGVLEGVVLEQIIKQQRPGGLLSPHTP
jgi:TP901 family phage tail tape measure protein